MCQLERQLHKGVGARAALLDEAFAEGVEREGTEIHILCQKARAAQGSLYHLLTLEGKRDRFYLLGEGGGVTHAP